MKLKQSNRNKTRLTKQEKKKIKNYENKLYRIMMGFMAFGAIYYFYFKPEAIGSDWKYIVFVFCIPTLLGVIIWGKYFKDYLRLIIIGYKGFFLRSFVIFFFLIGGIILSYLTFGTVADISWNVVNYQIANSNNTNIKEYDIIRFLDSKASRGRYGKYNYYVDYYDQKERERFKIDRSSFMRYKDEDPTKFKLILRIKEGVWSYCIVEDYSIVRK